MRKKTMTQTQELAKKRLFTHIDRVNTRNKAENIYINRFIKSISSQYQIMYQTGEKSLPKSCLGMPKS